jgi:hypothetical protein
MGSRQKAVKAFLAVCDDHAGSMDPRRAHFLDEQDAVALLFLLVMNAPAKITELLG